MINIAITIGEDAYMLTADGHANAPRNDKDNDLVCCAVSTIVQTLAFSCAIMEDVCTVYHTSSGHAMVTVTRFDELEGEITSRFQMAADGLTALAEQYPECIRLDLP